MYNRRQILLATALCAAPSVLRAQNQPIRVRFTLDWKLQGPHSIFFLAQDRGYFRDEGLDVAIDQGEGSAATTTRIMSGAYDAGFGDINAIVEQASKSPGKAPIMVYQYYNRPPFIIAVRARSGIDQLKDLEGRTIGAPAGSAALRLIPLLARRNNLDATKISISNVQPSLMEQLLVKEQVDGVSSYDNNVYINLLAMGKNPDADFHWFNFGDYGLNLYSNGVMVSRDLREKHPEAVRGMLRAINRATRETAENPDASMAVLMKIEPLLNYSLERRRIDFCFTHSFISKETESIGFGDVVDGRLADAAAILAEAYNLTRVPAVGDIFDRSFLPPREDRSFKYALAK
jgi:NitT/TauT family transport system substrate-binding protein